MVTQVSPYTKISSIHCLKEYFANVGTYGPRIIIGSIVKGLGHSEECLLDCCVNAVAVAVRGIFEHQFYELLHVRFDFRCYGGGFVVSSIIVTLNKVKQSKVVVTI